MRENHFCTYGLYIVAEFINRLNLETQVADKVGFGSLPNDFWLVAYGLITVAMVTLLGYGLLRRRTWAKGTVVALVSFICTGLAVEGLCALLLHWKESGSLASMRGHAPMNELVSVQQKNARLIQYDSLGMSRPAPGQYETHYLIRQRKTQNGQEIVSEKTIAVTYHIDSLSRRITPFTSHRANGKYALFLGCSFTYGEAVPDTSTLPYFFGQASGYRPYNYGVSGHSPAQMLALMQTMNLRKQVAEKEGIAIYTYIEDHLARVAPSTRWIANSNGYLPDIDLSTIEVDGSYAEKHPVRLMLINWLYKTNMARLFNIDFPKRYSTDDYRRFVNIVRKVKERYQQQFGNDNFYVVVFPVYPLNPVLRKLFNEAHLQVIDYANLFVWKTTYDGMHPDGDAYKQVACHLAKDLHCRETPRLSDQ